MIQEPYKPLCFSRSFDNHKIQTFSNKVAFEEAKRKATNLKRVRKPRLTWPFHTLSQWNSQPTDYENQWGNPQTLACFTAREIQGFEPTMLNCRHRKTKAQRELRRWEQRTSCPSPNAQLSCEQRCHVTQTPHLNHKKNWNRKSRALRIGLNCLLGKFFAYSLTLFENRIP